MASRKLTAAQPTVYRRVLTMDRETKGTYRYAAENETTGRDVTLYVEKVDFKMAGIEAPQSIVVTVEVA